MGFPFTLRYKGDLFVPVVAVAQLWELQDLPKAFPVCLERPCHAVHEEAT